MEFYCDAVSASIYQTLLEIDLIFADAIKPGIGIDVTFQNGVTGTSSTPEKAL